MSHEPPNSDPPAEKAALEEQLVAYLDGELDDETSHRVEQLLAADAKVRQTLEQFEGTWSLLDNLEQSSVDELFAQSTMEMVSVAAAEDVGRDQAEAPRRRRRRRLIGAAGVLAAGLAGFLAIALLWPNANERLIEELPVLENLDQYRQIDGVEFLELLLEQEDELFPEEGGDGP